MPQIKKDKRWTKKKVKSVWRTKQLNNKYYQLRSDNQKKSLKCRYHQTGIKRTLMRMIFLVILTEMRKATLFSYRIKMETTSISLVKGSTKEATWLIPQVAILWKGLSTRLCSQVRTSMKEARSLLHTAWRSITSILSSFVAILTMTVSKESCLAKIDRINSSIREVVQ